MVLHLKMHNHVIKQNSDMLSDATGCPTRSRKLYRGGFQHAESKFAIRFALSPLQAYKLSGTEQQSLKEVTYRYNV